MAHPNPEKMDKQQDIKASLAQLLYLGDPRLYEVCEEVVQEDLPEVAAWAERLHEVILAIRAKYGFGRAIAAPQLGIMKRMVYMYTDKPYIFLNPIITSASEEMMELWDDCMSFPNLLVRLKRHKEIQISYRDAQWQAHTWTIRDDQSELLQHEIDHLDGILCTMRALDDQSFKWRV